MGGKFQIPSSYKMSTVLLDPPINLSHPALQAEPCHRDLANFVTVEIPHKWRDVGIQLGLNPSQLESICDRCNRNPTRCYIDVFDIWMKEDGRTWVMLINALTSPAVDAKQLAHKISQDIINKFDKEKC